MSASKSNMAERLRVVQDNYALLVIAANLAGADVVERVNAQLARLKESGEGDRMVAEARAK